MADEPVQLPLPRRLGAYLFCSPAVIRSALQRQGLSLKHRRRQRKLGELLVESGAITTEELDTAIRTQRMARLRACELFASLSKTELSALSNQFDEVSLAAGEQFITEDEEDPTLYVLASGRLEVFTIDDGGAKIAIAEVAPPEPIGEMGYFAGGVRTASVRAVEAAELLRADYADLTHYFENVPRVAHAFLEVVERRRNATRLLARRREAQERIAIPGLEHIDRILDLNEPRRLERGMMDSIERLVRGAVTVTHADRGTLFLIDEESLGLWSMVAEGEGVDEIRLPIGIGVAGWVAEHNEVVNIADAYEDPRFNPEIDKRTGYRTRTILCAPVRDERGRVAGVVQVLNKNVGAFTEDDEALLRGFCEEVAIAVGNLEVYRRAMNDYQLMGAMLSVATIVGEVPDIGALTSRLGRRVAALMQCEACELYITDYDTDELWTYRHDGAAATTNRFPVAALPAGVAAVDGAVVNIRDTASEPGYDPAFDDRIGLPVRNLLAVPVLNGASQVSAVLQAVNKRGGAFGAADAALLKAIAVQIGRAAVLRV
jgi:GAF domain-containing protein